MFTPYNVFVYGTLREGHGNNRWLCGAEKVAKAMLLGYRMYSCGGFPAIVKGSGAVVGEIYRIETVDQQSSIDNLEGYDRGGSDNTFYDVDVVNPVIGIGTQGEITKECEVYVFNEWTDGEDSYIPSGDWEEHAGRW